MQGFLVTYGDFLIVFQISPLKNRMQWNNRIINAENDNTIKSQ